MIDNLIKQVWEHGGALTKTALGVVVVLCFGMIGWQLHATREDNKETRAQLMQLFETERTQRSKSETIVYQNQAAFVAGLNAIAVAVGRVEATLRILPADRGTLPKPEASPPVEIRRPPEGSP